MKVQGTSREGAPAPFKRRTPNSALFTKRLRLGSPRRKRAFEGKFALLVHSGKLPLMSLFQQPPRSRSNTPPATTPTELPQTAWLLLKLEKAWLSEAEQMNVYFKGQFKHPYPTTSAELKALQDNGVIRDIEEARAFVQDKMSYLDPFKDAAPRTAVLKLEKELAEKQYKVCDLPGHSL